LSDLMLDPSCLHSVQCVRLAEPFDCRHFGANIARHHLTGAHRGAADVNRARAALRNPAAIFRPGDSKLVTQDPQQRHIGLDIDLVTLAVNYQFHADRACAPKVRVEKIYLY
jgi:hypothetical protein